MMNLDRYKLSDYLRYVFGIMILIAIAAGGWFAFEWNANRLNQAAQTDFSELVESYKNATTNLDSEQINDLEKAFSISAEKHKRSKLYPYFLAYKAEALIWQNKLNDAVPVLSQSVKMLEEIDKENPLYYLYATKLAKLKMDIPGQEEEGKAELDKLNKIKNNPFKYDRQ